MVKLAKQSGTAQGFKDANPAIKSAGKEKEIDKIGESAETNIKKFIEVFKKHEKERLQSNQYSGQINQSSQPNKKDYP